MADVYIYKPDSTAVDVMASAIVQNPSPPPNYIWLTTVQIPSYGDLGSRLGNILPFQKTVAYKTRILDEIPHHDDSSHFVGSLSCISNPDSASCAGRGPYEINGSLYYIDFIFLYIVNEGNSDIYAPMLSVDTSRCNAYHGFVIGAPIAAPSLDATAGGQLISSAPKYLNFLNVFNVGSGIEYEWTAVDGGTNNIVSAPSVSNLVSVVENAINNGQLPVTMKDTTNTPITLGGQGAGSTTYYQPFVILRWIHESAPTEKINILIDVAWAI